MDFLLFFVAFLVGVCAGVFLVIQSLIVLFFGIPFTVRLKRMGVIYGRGPIPGYLVWLLVFSIVFALVTWSISVWLPDQLNGYWIGIGITCLFGFGRCGENSTNIAEYLQKNEAYIDPNAMEELKMGLEG